MDAEKESIFVSHSFLASLRKICIRWAPVLNVITLGLIFFLAFASRIFSVIRYESIIHEFDPWFNFRTTKVLAKEGFYKFFNWFDSESWYPLGRSIGGTVYPGIMSTASVIYWICRALLIPIEIRNVCVFMGPLFAGFTSLATYLLAKEVSGKSQTGLFAAFFISIVPTYMSRSVAGSYDNEAVAIFALVFTFYLFVKSVNTGSIIWAVACSLSYFYMVASWGGYTFIINIIPIYVLGVIFLGRYRSQLYVAYSVFYVLGTIFAIQIPFVGFLAVKSGEHMISHAVFIILQAYAFHLYLSTLLPKKTVELTGKMLVGLAIIGSVVLVVLLLFFGFSRWGGRSMTLLDPTYASKYIPIIASVSEHQATTWTQYMFDLHFLMLLTPVGFFFCCWKQKEQTNYGKLFVLLYGILAIYFSCVMIRLMLVMGPVCCVLSAIGVSEILERMAKAIRSAVSDSDSEIPTFKAKMPADLALVVIAVLCILLFFYLKHSTWTGAEAYSSPSVILSSRRGSHRVIIDDYREAYYWLRQNTNEDAKIMSWWDYGYQITGFSNRTVLVDNNTWNNTHIATVGRAMASREPESYRICRMLDVDYVLVIFGGMMHYSSDDISKFLWMVRIGGGVYPDIIEGNYYGQGQYRVDDQVTDTMKNCLMYKLCYYRFWEVNTGYGAGYDTVRQTAIGYKNYKLEYFSEAFTSTNWIVRIYKVNKPANRAPAFKVKGVAGVTAEPIFGQIGVGLKTTV